MVQETISLYGIKKVQNGCARWIIWWLIPDTQFSIDIYKPNTQLCTMCLQTWSITRFEILNLFKADMYRWNKSNTVTVHSTCCMPGWVDTSMNGVLILCHCLHVNYLCSVITNCYEWVYVPVQIWNWWMGVGINSKYAQSGVVTLTASGWSRDMDYYWSDSLYKLILDIFKRSHIGCYFSIYLNLSNKI